jgi:argininosuccinate lyase
MMKGTPLAYNKDMQEDKEAIFDAIDTVKLCLTTFIPMLSTMTLYKDNMKNAAARGFINATDCADYLVKKGLPFRDAYKITGTLVAYCIKNNTVLEKLSMDEFKALSDTFDEGVYDAIKLETCVNNRKADGGPAPEAVKKQIEYARNAIK